MSLKLGVIIDPIETIKPAHDSTFAMMLEAQHRGWPVYCMEQTDLWVKNNIVHARVKQLRLTDNTQNWFDVIEQKIIELHSLDVVLMRKDPPIDMAYIYTTQLLDLVAQRGTFIVNKPQSLRDYNEKLFIELFPQCIAPTVITADIKLAHEFLQEHHDIICKPLGGMGGHSIFRLHQEDPNFSVIVETMTQQGTQQIMLQRFIPEITQGDKRILLVDGKPIPHALARIAKPGETRANIAAGGSGVGAELSERDRWICQQIGSTLHERGILFAGIDVIGDYLTEINITSPTCVREIDKIFSLNISKTFLDCIEMYRAKI